IGELYSTEKSFHQLLIFTYNNYMKTMQKAVQGKDSLVKASDVQVLFYALPEMINVSENLLAYLKKYMDGVIYQECTPGMALGHIFKLLESKMVAFLKYATHYKVNMKSIRKARAGAYITKIENQLKLQKANNRLDLADYLIAPFQRVPRYGLLIKGITESLER
ncbi:Dbl homology domain-containing protein, partial [Backusella circina FSU 941]